MNAHSTTTSAPTPAIDPLAPKGPQSLTIDMAQIRVMSMAELLELRNAVHTTCDVVCGIMARPHFWKDNEDGRLNHAGHVLADINEILCGFESAIINVARATTPTTQDEAQEKGWLLVGFEADMRDDLTLVSAVAAQSVRDEWEASMGERRASA